jgi:hypothetical protein
MRFKTKKGKHGNLYLHVFYIQDTEDSPARRQKVWAYSENDAIEFMNTKLADVHPRPHIAYFEGREKDTSPPPPSFLSRLYSKFRWNPRTANGKEVVGLTPHFITHRRNGSEALYECTIYNRKRSIDREILKTFKPKHDGLDPLRMDYLVGVWFLSYDSNRPKEAQSAIQEALKGEPSPEAYVKAVKRASVPCRRCGGTGRFVTGVMNGKAVGPGGQCYRCGGKGVQRWEDGKRNYFADINQRLI